MYILNEVSGQYTSTRKQSQPPDPLNVPMATTALAVTKFHLCTKDHRCATNHLQNCSLLTLRFPQE